MNTQEIRLSFTSKGTTGKQWIKRLEKRCGLSDDVKASLLSVDFKPTKGVTYEVVVIKGSFWENADDRVVEKIRAEANKRKFCTLNDEVECFLVEELIKSQFAGIPLWWIALMREPVEGPEKDYPSIIYRPFGELMGAYLGHSDPRFDENGGFAFVLPQGV